MLRKLLKFEIQSMSRVFLPMYLAIIFFSFLGGVSMSGIDTFMHGPGVFSGFMMVIVTGLFIALFVITILMCVKRFSKNLLGDEGYLMMTLPVKTSAIIHSKWIGAFVWVILTSVVGTLSMFIIIFFASSTFNFRDLLDLIKKGLQFLHENNLMLTAIMFVILVLLNYVKSIFSIYLALSLAHLEPCVSHKTSLGFLFFCVINALESLILNRTTIAGAYLLGLSDKLNSPYVINQIFMNVKNASETNTLLIIILVLSFLMVVALYYLTENILNKHLNLQ